MSDWDHEDFSPETLRQLNGSGKGERLIRESEVARRCEAARNAGLEEAARLMEKVLPPTLYIDISAAIRALAGKPSSMVLVEKSTLEGVREALAVARLTAGGAAKPFIEERLATLDSALGDK